MAQLPDALRDEYSIWLRETGRNDSRATFESFLRELTNEEQPSALARTIVPIEERMLYAVRSIGILFIRSALAFLVGGAIAGAGYVILLIGAANLTLGAAAVGSSIMGIGALVALIWQITIIVDANRELKNSELWSS